MAEEGAREIGWLEWGVAGLGAALVVGVLGVLTHEALTYEDGPPAIIATVDDVSRGPGGYVVRFTAKNEGASTAAEILMLAELKQGDDVLESAEVTLDYVARKSSKQAGVVFARDPAGAELTIRATSYRKP
ncbi:TIGR02588 family protein [Methylopila sp. 73B]|uniref:TIGR02588 family protein n=1 Tax=Methylopila sp. 73B TaxID=1120792 RepID=UPI00035CB9AF|nr:TIGR02588 family protein [Methylopila sp. 73B]